MFLPYLLPFQGLPLLHYFACIIFLLIFLEINGEAFNVMGDWRSVAHFVKQHTNLIEKVILVHKSLLYKLKVMGGYDKGNGAEQWTVKTRGSHNGTKSRCRSKSNLETYSTEMWCGRNSPCVYNRQNETFDSDTTKH